MHCAIHTDREAIGACVYCGNGICRECLNKIDGKMYCETCALILGHKIEEERLREARLPVRVRYDNKPTLLSTRRPKEPWVAAFLSFLLPGLGQIYNGQLGKGILFFFLLYYYYRICYWCYRCF